VTKQGVQARGPRGGDPRDDRLLGTHQVAAGGWTRLQRDRGVQRDRRAVGQCRGRLGVHVAQQQGDGVLLGWPRDHPGEAAGRRPHAQVLDLDVHPGEELDVLAGDQIGPAGARDRCARQVLRAARFQPDVLQHGADAHDRGVARQAKKRHLATADDPAVHHERGRRHRARTPAPAGRLHQQRNELVSRECRPALGVDGERAVHVSLVLIRAVVGDPPASRVGGGHGSSSAECGA
jgi:hypothetical protein